MFENFTHENLSSLLVTTVILLSVIFSAFKSQGARKFLSGLSIWFVVIIIIITGYAFRKEIEYGYERVLAVLIPSHAWVNRAGELVIARQADGHFYLTAIVNKVPIKFLVDTGASDIALTKKDATKLGIDLKKLNYNKRYSTANGYNYAAPLTIPEISIGKSTFKDIKAHVGQGDLDISLFGMSAIGSFKSFKMEHDFLILSY